MSEAENSDYEIIEFDEEFDLDEDDWSDSDLEALWEESIDEEDEDE